jgi:hypothetical protein
MPLPDRLFTLSILRRSVGLWLGFRLAILAVGLFLPAGSLFPVGGSISLVVLGVTTVLAGLVLRRQNEFILLGNLGFGPIFLLMLGVLPVLALEIGFTAMAVGWQWS